MIRKKREEIEWLEFDLLAEIPGLVHGVFLRHGGVSKDPFGSLNAGAETGDEPMNIAENCKRIMKTLDIERCVGGRQVHSDEVVWVQNIDQQVGDCDGFITDRKNIGLMIKHADCQAAILYDPDHHAIANVHAGWRGNVKNIYGGVVKKMMKNFGSKPENLLVGVSPSLGPHHAEFTNYKTELPEEFWQFQVRPQYFDLWAIARYQFEAAGVLPHHIQVAGICTYMESEDYFSYRREKVSGRNATLVMLSSRVAHLK